MTLDLNAALGPQFNVNVSQSQPALNLTIVNNSGPSQQLTDLSNAPHEVVVSQPTEALRLTIENNCNPSQTVSVTNHASLGVSIQQIIPPTHTVTISPPDTFTLIAGVASGGTGGGSGGTSGSVEIAITAQEYLNEYRAVTIEGYHCQPNEDSLSRYAGITRGPVLNGQAVTVIKEGLLINNGWSWTPGSAIYVDVDGVLTHTPPSPRNRRIGYAVSPTQLNLDPFPFLELATAQW